MMSHRLFNLTAATMSIAFFSACDGFNSRLMTKHNSPQRKEQAQQRWDSVRGDIKFQLARQHLEAKRVDEAEKVLGQAIALMPNDPQGQVMLARLRIEQGRWGEAREALDGAFAKGADDAESHYLRGIVAQNYGDLETAAGEYDVASRRSPNSVEYVLARAETLLELDKTIEAFELTESRIKDFSESSALAVLAARASRSMGLHGVACEHCREALHLAPRDCQAAQECAEIFQWADRHDEAIAALSPLIDESGDDSVAEARESDAKCGSSESIRRLLAASYMETGRFREALQVLPSLANASDAATRLLIVRAAMACQDHLIASNAIAELRAQESSREAACLLAASNAVDQGEFAKAFELADEGAGMNRNDVAFLILKARSAEAQGHFEAARESYRAVLVMDPSDLFAAQRLAGLKSTAGCERTDGIQRVDGPVDTADRLGRWRAGP